MRPHRSLALLMLLAILLTAAGCAPAGDAGDLPERESGAAELQGGLPDADRSGNPIRLPAQVDAVISMAPSITQTLLDLGMEEKLIAVDTYSAMYFGLEALPAFDMMEPDTEQMLLRENTKKHGRKGQTRDLQPLHPLPYGR